MECAMAHHLTGARVSDRLRNLLVLDRLDVTRVPDPAGDRVVVVLDGKFLPYQW